MKLDDNVKIVFINFERKTAEITITVDKLLDCTKDDLYEMLEDTVQCTSASCNNESQNFCDCDSHFGDYVIVEVVVL